MKLSRLLLLVCCASLAASAHAGSGPSQAWTDSISVGGALGREWIARASDNICGLRDPAQVSNPALVDFKACIDATPELKRLRDQNIDPNSPQGIQLHSDAVDRVTKACESVRASQGYCSVWKEIRHKDGRAISNITDLVKAQF